MIKIDVALASKVLSVVDAGLSHGLGSPEPGKMCVEAAVAYACGEPHNDHPTCVHPSLASEKIRLNDNKAWGSNEARSLGLRRVAIAQLGSKNTFKYGEYKKAFVALSTKLVGKQNKKLLKQELAKALERRKKIAAGIEKDYRNDLKGAAARRKRSLKENAARIKRLKTAKDVKQLYNVDYQVNYNKYEKVADSVMRYVKQLIRVKRMSRKKALTVAAEEVVQILKKMKIPGTKFLHLTEKKAKRKAKL